MTADNKCDVSIATHEIKVRINWKNIDTGRNLIKRKIQYQSRIQWFIYSSYMVIIY